MSRTPIADYALLSDCHSAALVSRDGSVDWLCLPRFDAPAIFARLLDDHAGHWSIAPEAPFQVTRRYLDQTLVLATRFETATGAVELLDALVVGRNDRGHELGSGAPHALLRLARGLAGEVELVMRFAPRPEYGLVHPLLVPAGDGLVTRGGATILGLSAPAPLEAADSEAVGRFRLSEGRTAGFALQYAESGAAPPEPWPEERIAARIEDTVEAWRSWSRMHQAYQGPWRELVHQSGRVLQGLTYQPTGAIIAAPTTSLPEAVRRERNWDYRYCWARDASLTLEALWVAACPDEAHAFFGFLAGAAVTQLHRGGELQIVYGVGGEHDLSERTLGWLSGWRDSAPVRIGNDAWRQRQLDASGALLLAAERLREQLGEPDEVARRFLVGLVDAAARRWREPDHGIWEIRGPTRHYLHSKVMCWAALDRGVRLADWLGAADRASEWRSERARVRDEILARGWSERAGAFTQSFESDALDASSLVMPLVGFLPAGEPRMRATIQRIEADLTDERGLVYRYRTADGLEGEEGAFLLCTFWLAQVLAELGRLDRSRALIDRAAGFANDVGLLSEEVDGTGELLGNFPQAFSHVGLVNAAWAVAEAEGRTGEVAR